MQRVFIFSILVFLSVVFFSCSKNDVKQNVSSGSNTAFVWKESISVKDIPDFEVKGQIDGREIKFEYINFEYWRGSNDNVFNFSDKTPKNKCGFIENDNAFHLTKLGRNFKEGEFIKESFSKSSEGYEAYFHVSVNNNAEKFSNAWNCALQITEIDESFVKGKIAMCFKDEKKSWIAGSFTANRCNN